MQVYFEVKNVTSFKEHCQNLFWNIFFLLLRTVQKKKREEKKEDLGSYLTSIINYSADYYKKNIKHTHTHTLKLFPSNVLCYSH